MPNKQKVLWVPEWLANSRPARLGLGVLVQPGQEPPNAQVWRNLWEQRIKDLWEEDEDPRGIELVQRWEELEAARPPEINKPQDLVNLIDNLAAPGLWSRLFRALNGDRQAKEELLEKFPQEDPALSLEELLEEQKEAGLNDLAGGAADPSPYQRAMGL
jgi:hypothetical protein